MAEAVAVAGLIFSAFEVAQRVYKIGKAYVDTVKDGKRTFYCVLIEVSSVREVLECLQDLVETDVEGFSSVGSLFGDDGPVDGCRKVLQELEELLTSRALGPPPTGIGEEEKSWRVRCRQATRAVTWPSTLETVQRLQREISQYKSTMTLALQTNMATDIKHVKEQVNKLLESVSKNQLQETCDWFERTNPSFRHNEATRKHEAHTSEWVFRTGEWAQWSSRQSRFLWIHGIPGAGKTVLSSFLITQLQSQCDEDHGTAVAYYYCFYGHNQDETTPFLSWLLSQLCRKAGKVPSEILELRRRGHKPDDRDLCEGLWTILPFFDVVYVAIDAVDESKDRENLIDALLMLATDERFSKIQLLATSREYQDLDEAFRPVSTPLSLSHEEVEKDIRTYIHSQLAGRPARIKTWSETLLTDVEDTLATQAKGMFQWAFCQVKRLEKFPAYREPEIREALATLPKTLFGTYERILLDIPDEDKKLGRDTLLYMYFFPRFDSARFAPHDDQFVFSRDYILYELELLATTPAQAGIVSEACGCLIKDLGHDIEFTHYTVTEFLESDYLATHVDGRLRYFALAGNAVQCEYVTRHIRLISGLQRNILSRHPTLPGHVCETEPRFVRELLWPVVMLGNIVGWLSQQPSLPEPFSDTAWREWKWKGLQKATRDRLVREICRLFQPEQGTIIPRFIPWYQVGTHQWHISGTAMDFEDMERFQVIHGVLVIRRDIKMTIICALLGFEDGIALTLDGTDVAELLDVEVTLNPKGLDALLPQASDDADRGLYNARDHPNFSFSFPSRTVSGNLVSALGAFHHHSWLASFYAGSPVTIFIHAITYLNSLISLSAALLYFLSVVTPRYDKNQEYEPPCTELGWAVMLARLLDNGADPNTSEYALTPLQLAVEKRNIMAVRILLQRGADPDGIGREGGKVLKMPGFGQRWRHTSPLRINRQAPHPLEELYPGLYNPECLQQDISDIEELLEKHGARDFEVAPVSLESGLDRNTSYQRTEDVTGAISDLGITLEDEQHSDQRA